LALTLTEIKSGVQGDLAYWIGSALWDTAYAVGGESFTAANAGLSEIYYLTLVNDTVTSTTGLSPIWDKSASKIILIESGGASGHFPEVDTDNISNLITYIKAEGRR
tara:strand:- start:506 stop:826 length:321 start_codon:yes stop_codon:yes gene_type:complete